MTRFTLQFNAAIPTSTSKQTFVIPFKVSDLIPESYRNSNFTLYTSLSLSGQTSTSSVSNAGGCLVTLTNLTSPFTIGTQTLIGSASTPTSTTSALILGLATPSLNGIINTVTSGTTSAQSTSCTIVLDDSNCIKHTIKYPTVDSLVIQLESLGAGFNASNAWMTLAFEPE